MCRHANSRVQFHVVPGSVPPVARSSQQVVNLEALVRRKAQPGHVQLDEAPLPVLGIQVHHNHNRVASVLIPLAEAEQRLVVRSVDPQAPVAVQGGILTANPVHTRDQRRQAVRPFRVPVADLVFLRIEVFLAAWPDWLVLH